jgi:predicted DNA binding CopG/RHH family protein
MTIAIMYKCPIYFQFEPIYNPMERRMIANRIPNIGQTMTRQRTDNRRTSQPPSRKDLRLPADLLERIRQQAERLGLSDSAYIRQAIARQVERDESESQRSRRS